MATESVETDKGIGLTVIFAILAFVGAATMLAGPEQFEKALGFALAMVAALLAVTATHAYA